jgi:hypothetical protein
MPATTTAISGQSMFSMRFMAGVAYVALTIPRLVSVEVVEPLLPAPRQRPGVTMVRIVAVVDVAEKAARTVKPGAGSEKYSADKPIRPIVAIWSAVVGGIVEVTVGADGRRANVYADRNLG